MQTMDSRNYRKSMSVIGREGSFNLSFAKTHKKSNSDNDTSAELRALREKTAVNATKKNLVSQKLKKFLSTRPTQEDLYARNILNSTTSPYPPLPPKLSIFFKIQQAFEKAQGSQHEGIFRVSGNSTNISKVYHSIYAEQPNFQGVTAHDLAGVMKLYIRQLAIPLVPVEMFQSFVDAQRIDDARQRLEGMKMLLRFIPEDNMLLLRALVIFLEKVASHVAVNKMTPHNLSVCFGPNVLRSPKDGAEVLTDIEVQCQVVATMITHRVELFGETPTGRREERSQTISHGGPPPMFQDKSALTNLPPPPPSPHTPPLGESNNTHNSNNNSTGSPTSPHVVPRKTLGSGKPPVLLPPPLITPPLSSLSSLPPPPPLSLPNPLSLPPPPPLSHDLPPPPPPVSVKTETKRKDDYFDEEEADEEMYLALIDDLEEEDKEVLSKKLAAYFTADAEGFRRFLRKAVGAEGVIALLELLVM